MSHFTGRSWPLLCSISSDSLACTPLASESCLLVYSAALNPITFYHFYFRPHHFDLLGIQLLLCLSIVCQIQLHGQPPTQRRLPPRPSLRPTTQSSREKSFPSFIFATGVSPSPSFTNESSSLSSTLGSRPSQLCHTLFQLPTATHSGPKSRISISTRLLFASNSISIQRKFPQPTLQDASLQLLQAPPRASPECDEECGQPSPAQGEEETLNPNCKTPTDTQLSFLTPEMILTAWQSEPFGFRHVTTNIEGLSEDEYVSPCLTVSQAIKAPPPRYIG